MNTDILKFRNIEMILIYISKKEKEQDDIKEKIKEYKKKYLGNVAIFISGDNNIEKTFRTIF